VFGLGPGNTWDMQKYVHWLWKSFLSDEEMWWYMGYYGKSNGNLGLDSIGLAVSSNGIRWERG